jgi:hypothetical protein
MPVWASHKGPPLSFSFSLSVVTLVRYYFLPAHVCAGACWCCVLLLGPLSLVHVWYSLDSSTSSRSASRVKESMNRLHHHVSSMVSIRHNDGFDSLSNNLGRIPNLARTVASKSIIFCFVFYYSLVDEFSTYGGLAFSTNLINVFVRIWITDQTYYRF